MNENRFVVVGRIEQIIALPDRLRLILGGPGPVKQRSAVEFLDLGLIGIVQSANGFVAGDLISVSGRLFFDAATGHNVAIASPDGVSRIARGATGGQAVRGGSGMFAGRPLTPPSATPSVSNVANLPPSFAADPGAWPDVPF